MFLVLSPNNHMAQTPRKKMEQAWTVGEHLISKRRWILSTVCWGRPEECFEAARWHQSCSQCALGAALVHFWQGPATFGNQVTPNIGPKSNLLIQKYATSIHLKHFKCPFVNGYNHFGQVLDIFVNRQLNIVYGRSLVYKLRRKNIPGLNSIC